MEDEATIESGQQPVAAAAAAATAGHSGGDGAAGNNEQGGEAAGAAAPAPLPTAVEFEPPFACVRRILKNSLPSSTNVGKDASAAFARATGACWAVELLSERELALCQRSKNVARWRNNCAKNNLADATLLTNLS
jgi:hypothetical protein